jgi:hypothetical protein
MNYLVTGVVLTSGGHRGGGDQGGPEGSRRVKLALPTP